MHVRVGWRDALNATLCAQGSAFLTKYGAKPLNNGTSTTTLTNWASKAEAWAKYNEGGAWADTLDKDVRIIVARPFIECAPLPAVCAPLSLLLRPLCLPTPARACAGTRCTT